MFSGEASGGIEYCHAPIAVLRSSQASTMLTSPSAPALIRSRAFWYTRELTYWLPDLEDPPAALLRLDYGFAFGDRLHHRLLAIDVLAGVEGVDADAGVPVVRRGDDDGIDVLARQDLAVVARREDAGRRTVRGRGSAGRRRRRMTAASSTPGTFSANRVSPLPMPPNPIVAMRILSLGEGACVSPDPAVAGSAPAITPEAPAAFRK